MKPTAYEGKEPYVFISYAHKDNDSVMAILEQLELGGIRFWYDDGIAPGSEWPENIAQHLDGCALVIAFISPNSVASANCRREVTFALSRHKPLLAIALEKTEMSMGLELQLSAHQCIFRYNYRREEDFIQKILSCPDLDPCRIPAAPEQMPDAMPVPDEVTVPVEAEKPVKPAKAAKPAKTAKPRKAAREKKRPKWLLPVLAALVLVPVLLVVFTQVFFRVRITEDVVVKRSTTYLSLTNTDITEATVRQINKLAKLTQLRFASCDASGQVLEALELEDLKYFIGINSPVGTLEFLKNSPGLYELQLDNCGITNQMLEDANLPAVKSLKLKNNPELTVLSGLDLSKLMYLQLENTGVADITFLENAEQLRELNCSGTAVTDITPLAALKDLEVLNFSGCALSDVTQSFMSLSIHSLSLNGCGLTDISGFYNLTILKKADLGGNRFTDVSWLEKSIKTLTSVNLAFNPLTPDQIGFLAKATTMTELNLDGIAGIDLALVRMMPELQKLSARNCGISDISALTYLAKLADLRLSGNQLQDISDLPSSIGTQLNAYLDLAYNQITNANYIPRGRYHTITLQGNPIEVNSKTFLDLSATILTMDYHEGFASCASVSKIADFLVADVPMDQQLALEKVLGYTAEFVTTEELLERLESTSGIVYDDLTLAN